MTRSLRLPRLSRLLLLAAALAALAVVFVHHAPTARAGTAATLGDDERLLGVGTLTVGAGANWRGFRHSPSTGQLTRTWFTYQGVNYTIRWLNEHNTSDFLILELDKAISAGLKSALVLYIEDRRFALADGVINPTNSRQIRWANSGEGWTAGQQFHVTTSFTDYWSATLNVKTVNGLGCQTSSSTTANKCSTSATLSDNTITLRGTTHTISGVRLFIQGAERNLFFDLANPSGTYGSATALERYTLYVGDKPFHFTDATAQSNTNANGYWTNTGLTWSAGQTVQLRLTKRIFTGVTFRDDTTSLPTDALSLAENGESVFQIVLPRDPGASETVTVRLSKMITGCAGCPNSHVGDPGAVLIDNPSRDIDSSPETVTVTFGGGTNGNWNQAVRVRVRGVPDADGQHEHVLIVATVSTASGNHPWYNATDGSNGIFITVIDGTDDGRGSPGTEADLGRLKRPEEAQPEPQVLANNAPTVAAPLADVIEPAVGGGRQIDLSSVFADADGDALTYSAATTNEDISVGYIDGAGMLVLALSRGTVTITVTADDGNGGTVSDSFTVTVKEAPTVASPLADISELEAGASQQVSLSGVFADADGDALTLSAASSDTAVATATVGNGSLTVTAQQAGTATITVTAQDTDGNQVSDTFDVTVSAPPQVEATGSAGSEQEQDAVARYDADQDGVISLTEYRAAVANLGKDVTLDELVRIRQAWVDGGHQQ